jgi:large subunit ribosomal protein L10
MDRARKQTELDSLKETLSTAELMVISHNKGMTVAQVTELRRNLAKTGAKYKITKNTLTKIAAKGTKFEQASDFMTGPTGFTTVKDDPYGTLKALYEFSKKSNGKIALIGGVFGDLKLDAAAVEKMAKLPSLNEIRGILVGLIQAPAAQLARLANAYATKDAQS